MRPAISRSSRSSRSSSMGGRIELGRSAGGVVAGSPATGETGLSPRAVSSRSVCSQAKSETEARSARAREAVAMRRERRSETVWGCLGIAGKLCNRRARCTGEGSPRDAMELVDPMRPASPHRGTHASSRSSEREWSPRSPRRSVVLANAPTPSPPTRPTWRPGSCSGAPRAPRRDACPCATRARDAAPPRRSRPARPGRAR
jgi:hypothetical protein